MFTGNFASGQTKSMCPKSKFDRYSTTKFEVQNQNNGQGFDLGDDDCVKRLYSEIDSCNWGGESSYSGWRFRWVVLFLFFRYLRGCSLLMIFATGSSRMDARCLVLAAYLTGHDDVSREREVHMLRRSRCVEEVYRCSVVFK